MYCVNLLAWSNCEQANPAIVHPSTLHSSLRSKARNVVIYEYVIAETSATRFQLV